MYEVLRFPCLRLDSISVVVASFTEYTVLLYMCSILLFNSPFEACGQLFHLYPTVAASFTAALY